MMTTAEFLTMADSLPYVHVLTVSSCVTYYFDECYDERHELTDAEQEQFDMVYDLLVCRGLHLTDASSRAVDSYDGSDSWDE